MVKIDIDISVIIQIINFLVLIILMNYFLYRPIRGILKQRREVYAGFETEIQGLTRKADEAIRQLETDLVEARKLGFIKKDEIKGVGLEEEKRLLAEASEETMAEIERVKGQVAEEIRAARDVLRADVETFSQEVARKLLGRSLS